MSLSFNSNANVSTGSASIDYSLHYVIYFWFCEYLIIFDWLSVLVSAGYFCVHVNILEFFNGIQLSYLKKVWSFWILLLWFIRWVSVSSQLFLAAEARQGLTEYSPQCSMKCKFDFGNRHSSRPFVGTKCCSLISSEIWASSYSLACSVLCWILVGDTGDFQGFLFMQLLPIWCSVLWTPATLTSLLNSGSLLGSGCLVTLSWATIIRH